MSNRFSFEAIFKAVDKFTQPVKKMEKQTERMARRSTKSIDRMNNAFKRLGRTMRGMVVGGGVFGFGVGHVMKDMVTLGAEFEHTLVATGIRLRDPIRRGTDAFEKLKEKALETASVTEFTSMQVARSMLELSKVGVGSGALGALLDDRTLVDIATVAMVDLDDATRIALGTLGGFNELDPDNPIAMANALKEFGNMMAFTANRAKTDIPNMFEAIRMSAPIFEQGKIAAEDYFAMLGLLGNAGIEATQAGTGLRNIALALLAPTTESKKIQSALGMDRFKPTFDSNNRLLLSPYFKELLRQFDARGMSDKQRMGALEMIFQKIPLPSASVLTGISEVNGIANLSDQIRGVRRGNYIRDVARQQRDTTKGAFMELMSTWEATRINVFDEMAVAIEKTTRMTTDWLRLNRKIIAENIGGWINWLLGDPKTLGATLVTWAKLLTAVLAITVAMKSFILVVTFYNAVMAVGLGFSLAMVAVFGLLTYTIYKLMFHWDDLIWFIKEGWRLLTPFEALLLGLGVAALALGAAMLFMTKAGVLGFIAALTLGAPVWVPFAAGLVGMVAAATMLAAAFDVVLQKFPELHKWMQETLFFFQDTERAWGRFFDFVLGPVSGELTDEERQTIRSMQGRIAARSDTGGAAGQEVQHNHTVHFPQGATVNSDSELPPNFAIEQTGLGIQ